LFSEETLSTRAAEGGELVVRLFRGLQVSQDVKAAFNINS
jgi:hypothetical protein